MNRLISIFIITITLHGVCHAQSLKAELYDNIKQQVQSGVFNRLTDEELTNVKCEAMIIGATIGDIQKISPALIQWTTTESQWVSDEVLKILESDETDISEAKSDIILPHVKHLTAYKTGLWSSHKPSEELAKIIAMEVVSAIQYANRSDIDYPDTQVREQAKEQITEFASYLKSGLLNQTEDSILQEIVDYEIDQMISDIHWRVDSPFFPFGKRLYDQQELDKMVAEGLDIVSGMLHPDVVELYIFDKTPSIVLDRHFKRMHAKVVIHKGFSPIIKAYKRGREYHYGQNEYEEIKGLLKIVQNQERREMGMQELPYLLYSRIKNVSEENHEKNHPSQRYDSGGSRRRRECFSRSGAGFPIRSLKSDSVSAECLRA